MRPFIKIDDQVQLHLARLEFASALFKQIDSQREYLREWLSWVDTTHSTDDTLKFLKESMKNNSNGKQLITVITHDNTPIGTAGFHRLDTAQATAELGYWLSAHQQKKGIMTKVVHALITHVFKTKATNRVEIRVASPNLKSKAIPIRLGFHLDGVLREGIIIHKKFYDIEVYSILKREWL